LLGLIVFVLGLVTFFHNSFLDKPIEADAQLVLIGIVTIAVSAVLYAWNTASPDSEEADSPSV
jgi:uncharacterized membrane protein